MVHENLYLRGKVIFSPDGQYVATGTGDYDNDRNSAAWVWETATGKHTLKLHHDSYVMSIAFSLDGKYLATSSKSGNASVWELNTGREVAHLEHDTSIDVVAFSPDGRLLATGGEDSMARVWDIFSGREISRLKHETYVQAISFSPDGKYVTSACASPFQTSHKYTARVWEVNSGEEIARLTHDSSVKAVAFSPDGKLVATASMDHSVRLWDPFTPRLEIARHKGEGWSGRFGYSLNGKYLAVVASGYEIQLWDVASWQISSRLKVSGDIFALAVSDNGQFVATIEGEFPVRKNTLVRVFDIQTGRIVSERLSAGLVSNISLSSDGRYLLEIRDDQPLEGLEASTGNKMMFGGKEQAYVIDSKTGKVLVISNHRDQVPSAVFSPDGRYIATGSNDKTVKLWEINTGQERASFDAQGRVNEVKFSPDGSRLVAACYDGSIIIWEVQSRREICHLKTTGGVTHDTSFSIDGHYLALLNDDQVIRIWDINKVEEIARLRSANDDFHFLLFTPDNRIGVGEGEYFRSQLWHPRQLLEEACSRISRNFTAQEWEQYLPTEPYQKICPNLGLR